MTRSRTRGLALVGLTFSTLLALGCEPPPVVATEDVQQQTPTARIEGTVVVQSRARGNAVVLLYDAARPPPPQGTGRPLSFTVIPQEELFGAELDSASVGPFTAPFIFPLVPPGKYLLRGFIDGDPCRVGGTSCHGPDFIPWFNVTGEPNVGDVAGAAVDPLTRVPRVVEVGLSESGQPLPVLGVPVSFSDATAVPVDRPTFEVVGTARFEQGESVKLLQLRALPVAEGVMNLREPRFLVRFSDEDRDRDGNLDLWPRIVVRKLASDSGLTDENDLDANGALDEQGVDYPRLDNSLDGKPDLVVLGSRLVTDAFIGNLIDENGNPRMDAVLPLQELTLAVRLIAYDAKDPSAPAQLKTVPPGRYAVIVLQSTGQTWRVPNELSPGLAEPRGLPPVGSQAFVLEVP